jgi:hypothetical protein
LGSHPFPASCFGELEYVRRPASVLYSNQAWVIRPLGFTVPFRVALFSVMDVAATDVAMGGKPGLLVDSPPLRHHRKMTKEITGAMKEMGR